jgi:hypothetical protein
MRQRLEEYDRAGLTPRAIAAKLGVPQGLVRSQLTRLRRKRQAAAVFEEAVILGVALAALAFALALALSTGLAQAPLHGYDRLKGLLNRGPAPPPVPHILATAVTPSAPVVSDEAPVGAPLAQLSAQMSDGSAFGGYFGFGPPHYDAGGCVAVSGHALILACGLDPSIDRLRATVVAVAPRPSTR